MTDASERNGSGESPQRRRMARIADVAALSGASTATVDRVLNQRPGVRAATVQRVLAERGLATESREEGTYRFICTEDAERFRELVVAFKHALLDFVNFVH